jgi:hypothetical protein
LLPYPRSLTQGVLLSSQPRSAVSLAGTRDPGTWASSTAASTLPTHLPKLAERQRCTEERKALRESSKFGGYQSSTKQLWPQRGPLYRVDGPSGFTQVAEESWKDH